ncbi:MAG: ATP-binding protein [Helicobacter sp.]|nr:ATP-binding protein [Helicobacter sp.]
MEIRGFVIRNFRNIGLCEGDKSQEAFLRLSNIEGKFGGLTILIGESNSGKSNLLKALEKFGHSYLSLNSSQSFEGTQLLSQDDVPESSQSILTTVALACQEPAYYLHYSQEIAPKSGAAQRKRRMGKPFDLKKHIKELQKDFDNLDVYRERNEHETANVIKLLLKDSSSNVGRFMRCKKEPLENIDDHSVDELNVTDSDELNCSFVVGYEALDVKQNFVDYINDFSQPIKSSVVKEYGHTIWLENDEKLRQEYYADYMKVGDNENIFLQRHTFQKLPDAKREQLRVPKIVFYDETQFCDDDLSTTPDKIKESKLFRGGITKKLMQINQDFNMLYGENGKESYRFELNIDIDKFALEIYKGEQALSLAKQGNGFERLFNFVFSLAQQIDGLEKGDIVLIDDVEKYLSVPIQKRLRKYLKELAQKNGILFIVSTHSPFMIDRNCLDEIRLLKPKDNGLGTEIVDLANADGTIKENEFDYIADIVGVNYRKPS